MSVLPLLLCLALGTLSVLVFSLPPERPGIHDQVEHSYTLPCVVLGAISGLMFSLPPDRSDALRKYTFTLPKVPLGDIKYADRHVVDVYRNLPFLELAFPSIVKPFAAKGNLQATGNYPWHIRLSQEFFISYFTKKIWSFLLCTEDQNKSDSFPFLTHLTSHNIDLLRFW